MATTHRDHARRERYAAFDSTTEGSSLPKSPKFTNKWEIVLVLIVVAAGVVITTIAAIKAKEKSAMEYDDGGLTNSANEVHEVVTKKPSSKSPGPSKPRHVSTTTTTTSLPPTTTAALPTAAIAILEPRGTSTPTRDSTATESMSNEKPSSNFEDFNGYYGPDYDAEYDLVQPKRPAALDDSERDSMASDQNDKRHLDNGGDPMAAESEDDRQQMKDFVFQAAQNAYRPSMSSMANVQNHNQDNLPGFAPPRGFRASTDHNRNAELAADGAGFVLDELLVNMERTRDQGGRPSMAKARRHYPNGGVDDLSRYNRPLYENHEVEKVQMKPSSTQFAPTISAIPPSGIPLNVFLPPMPSMAGNINQKLPVFVEDTDASQNAMMRKQDKQMQSSSSNVQNTNQEPPKMSFAQQFAAQFIPQGLMPRRFGMPMRRSRRQTRTWLGHRLAGHKYRPRRSEKRINKRSTESVLAKDSNSTEPLETAASEYYPFDDDSRSGIPPPVYDNSGYYGNGSRRRPQGASSERRRSGPKKSARRPNHNSFSNYPAVESRQGKKSWGILGSGNFEVIRGGIYSDDETSASDKSYARGPPSRATSKPGDYDDAESGGKKYYNVGDEDYFARDPVLGFQGYDNFHSASTTEEKKTSSSSAATVFVDTDHDLMATA